MSSIERKEIPIIDTNRFNRWKFLFKAYLGEKKCSSVLTKEIPTTNQVTLVRLTDRDNNETEASRKYRRLVNKKKSDWKTVDEQAYGYLVRACEPNASAMEVILREEMNGVYTSTILEELEKTFSQAEMTGVIQAKLALFHSTEIGPKRVGRKFRQQTPGVEKRAARPRAQTRG